MPGTSNFGYFWPLFLLKKVNFVICLSGSVKMPFWPYFDPILSPPEPNFWPWPKCAYLFPARKDLGGDLWGTPNLTLFWPFWDPLEGPGGRLQLGPLMSCLWLEGPVWTLANPCLGPQILVILTTFGPPVRPRNDLILDHFGPKTSRPGNLRCPDRALLEAVGLDLVKMSILAYFGPFWRRLQLGPYELPLSCGTLSSSWFW